MIYNGDTMRKTEWTYSVLRDYKAPTGPKQMQRFLALGQYYGKYTEGYAKLVAPLRSLERKTRWSKGDMAPGTREHDLFLEIKERLTEDVRLALPDWSREFIIKSDFSDTAMGGARTQDQADRVCFAEMRGRLVGRVGARWRIARTGVGDSAFREIPDWQAVQGVR